MKNSVLFAFVFLFACINMQAQQTLRIGYVDMDYILENVPEYQEASTQLDDKVQDWRLEIEKEMERLEILRTQLENEKALLTPELIEEREEEIEFEEQRIRAYQQRRFGPNGDMMTQKLQLVQPIQDQVFIAIQEIAASRKYDLILDKSADMVMLYAAERLDVSDQVLRSITRAANREQITSRKEREELVREEAKTVVEDAEVTERELEKARRQNEREAFIEQRKEERDSIRAARQKAFDDRRAKILEERQQRKDSINEVRHEAENTED